MNENPRQIEGASPRAEATAVTAHSLPYARFAVAQGPERHERIPLTLVGPDGVASADTQTLVFAAAAAFAARLLGLEEFHLGAHEAGTVWPVAVAFEEARSFAELVQASARTLARRATLEPTPAVATGSVLPYPLTVDLSRAGLAVDQAEFVLAESEGAWQLIYDASLVPRSSAELLARQFSSYWAELVALPAQPLTQRPLLDAEQQRLLARWNDTALTLDETLVLPAAFQAQVARTPSAIALSFRDQELSYRELAERVSRLAARLRAAGVGPEVRVGVYCARSLEMVIAVLAVLHAGGAYVPLDPSFPADRVRFMIDDTGMGVVLAQSELHAALAGCAATVLDVHDDPGAETDVLTLALRPDHLAYVLFTSGSTGRPKGVMVEHRNVMNLFAAMDAHLGQRDPGVWLSVTSLSFDISVVELLWSLCRGFKVVLYREPARDGVSTEADESFAQLARKHAVTHLQCTPTMANMFLADPAARAEFHRLQEIILAGEAYPIALARQLRTYTQATLRNIYGPTETTVYSVGQLVDPESDAVPIGRPLGNTEVYVLDAKRRPVPVGVPGELFIGGRGVTRGYLGRGDLTAQRFVADPFSSRPGARLYRTGDLVRFREDGTLDFLGRIDHQVKIRGYRMELGEIENVLSQHPAVRESVVTVREDIPGNKRLVAYVVARQPGELSDAALRRELKEHLKQKLPVYMVPANFAFLDAFPQTTSGKVDRKALPAPEALKRTQTARPALSASA